MSGFIRNVASFFQWGNWTPTLTPNGAMTLSNMALLSARYIKIGKMCWFNLDANFTVGGTLNNTITFNLPVPCVARNHSAACTIAEGFSTIGAGAAIINNGGATITKYNVANFIAGGTNGSAIRVTGFYESSV